MTFIPFAKHHRNYFDAESNFSRLYPLEIGLLDRTHWSPLQVIHRAVQFLATKPRVKILDIGSGSGKFCLAGAYYKPSAVFYGVEQRAALVKHAETACDMLRLQNAHFIHHNFTQLDFTDYDHFYFYNSFYENLSNTNKIDDELDYSASLYSYYSRYLFKKLEDKVAGTRLVTFQSLESEIPYSYRLVRAEFNGQLKCWEKI